MNDNKQQQRKATMPGIERDLEKRLDEMYRNFPDIESERFTERELGRKLGGPLAERFFV